MAKVELGDKKSFVLQQEMAASDTGDSSRQPLELHHLSHDLRGPLNSILGFSELMLEGIEGPLNMHQEADLAAINQSARNLLWLIDTVVVLSRFATGQLIMESGTVDLNQIIQNIMAFDFGTIKSEQVELAFNLPDTLPPLWGALDRVEQMVMSLVRFSFKMQKTGRVTITANSDDQQTTIQVKLDSFTLSPEQLAGLFELDIHVDVAGRTELGPGGLELPLAHRLAEKHNGRVWAESKEDSGTALYLRLPLYA